MMNAKAATSEAAQFPSKFQPPQQQRLPSPLLPLTSHHPMSATPSIAMTNSSNPHQGNIIANLLQQDMTHLQPPPAKGKSTFAESTQHPETPVRIRPLPLEGLG